MVPGPVTTSDDVGSTSAEFLALAMAFKACLLFNRLMMSGSDPARLFLIHAKTQKEQVERHSPSTECLCAPVKAKIEKQILENDSGTRACTFAVS